MFINKAYYENYTGYISIDIIDKKDYHLIIGISNLIITPETIAILLLCKNVTLLTILLPGYHPIIKDTKYYNDTISALLPPVILCRYKLDIELVDRSNIHVNIWDYTYGTNSYYTYNAKLKLYYFKFGMPNFAYTNYKIIMYDGIEHKPINNLYHKMRRLILDNKIHMWLNYPYGLKKLMTYERHNIKIPYK